MLQPVLQGSLPLLANSVILMQKNMQQVAAVVDIGVIRLVAAEMVEMVGVAVQIIYMGSVVCGHHHMVPYVEIHHQIQ